MKKILILTFSFLLVGCSAEYTLTIDGNNYHENINIQSSNEEDRELLFSNTWMIPIDYHTYNEMDDSDYEINDTIEHYKYTAGDNNINFNYNFNSSNIQSSTALHKCYESSRIVRSNNQIIITTNNENTCFTYDPDLETLTINIIINDRNVIYSNEDKKVNNKYIWYINRDNYLQKSINVTIADDIPEISSSSSFSQKENKNRLLDIEPDISFIIFGIIFFIVVGIVIIIYQKIQKDDK